MDRSVVEFSIDRGETQPLSPYIFSHNLEHTRAAVCGGLSAQMLRNRKFAGKPSKNEGVAAEWFSIGEKVLFENSDPAYTRHTCLAAMFRRNELQSQTVHNLRAGQTAGIGQYDIPVEKGKTYEMRAVAFVSAPVLLRVTLTDRSGEKVYAEHTVSLIKTEWETVSWTMTSAVTDMDAAIRYTFTERAKLVIGALSMMPENHFHGLRRDVVDNLKALGPAMIRWPGGNFAGEYRWKDGLLDPDQRGPLQACMEIETQPYTAGYDDHDISTDDFIALCREVGAEPFLTINLFWSTPEESAEWVEYCNGSADTEYGRLRAERGHPEPYHVKFWSLGNEMGFGHMEGPMTPEAYASLAGKQAEAMAKVSPDICFCSSGPYPNDAWAKDSAAKLFPRTALTSVHCYTGVAWNFTTEEDVRSTYEHCVAGADSVIRCAEEMRKCLDRVCPDLSISFDEWNVWYAWYRPSCVSEGMYCAKVLHAFLTESNRLRMPVCCYFQPVGEGAILIGKTDSRLTANGQMFSVMKAHKGASLCKLDGAEPYSAAASIKDGRMTVTLINDSYDTEKEFRFPLPGTLSDGRLYFSDDVTPHSFFEERALEIGTENGIASAVLPPHSVASVVFDLD